MTVLKTHTVHIPVLGLGYSIDTPLKVAKFGISSVISIMDDELVEKMREYHCGKANLPYEPIDDHEADHRARRITAYLNVVNKIVQEQVSQLRREPFRKGSDIEKYFDILPEMSRVKRYYRKMKVIKDGRSRKLIEKQLRKQVTAGAIDVNIMVKVDNMPDGETNEPSAMGHSDALSALRGFALSDLESSVVLSAGYNPRLYSYLEHFKDFYPDENGSLRKKIILKVSDFRSALIQGKMLAKKGLWVSEFRIESGLNCGGHAFATDGLLLGPILEEFKSKRQLLASDLCSLCNLANKERGVPQFSRIPEMKITAQGGIGTARENDFLMMHYELDGTGWGSPFLLVPEATNVDTQTLHQLATAKREDYFLSSASPLGIPFNNFRHSSSEQQRKNRIEKGKPGSPCYKKLLAFDKEFTDKPICTASRQYQRLKIAQLKEKNLPADLFEEEFDNITAKDCLCEGLAAPALIKNGLPLPHKLSAVTICPGPNLAYFSGVFSLSQMLGHIYGRLNILNPLKRPHLFVNELKIYVDYFKDLVKKAEINPKQIRYLQTFRANLLEGIEYYNRLIPSIKRKTDGFINAMRAELLNATITLNSLAMPAA